MIVVMPTPVRLEDFEALRMEEGNKEREMEWFPVFAFPDSIEMLISLVFLFVCRCE